MPTLFGEFLQLDAKYIVTIWDLLAPVSPTVHVHQLASPPLGVVVLFDSTPHSQSALSGL